MFEIGQWIENQYLVLEKRRGRRWTIYVALDRMSENVFAVKTPAAAFPNFSADRFKQRAKTWIDLGQSEAIVTAFLLKEFHDAPHLFIEYVEGPTLADVICSRHGKPLPIKHVVSFMRRIAKGMSSLHKAKLLVGGSVTHGNLSPRNIVTGSDGVRMTDIGLASAFDMPAGIQNADLTLRCMPCVAPERIENPAAESKAGDIYSFGAMAYELVTGAPPTAIKSPDDPLSGYVASEPVPPKLRNRACPAWLEGAILKCMAREPENRFQSFENIETLLDEMEAIVEDDEESPQPEERGRRTSRVARARGMAKKESGRLNHYYLGVEHMMLGLLAEEEAMVLSTLGDAVTAEQLRSEICSGLPTGEGPWHWEGIIKTPRYRRIMRKARKIRHEYGDERMLPQHIFLAILTEGQSMPVRALRNLGTDIEEAVGNLRRELGRRRPAIFVTDPDAAATPFAHKMSTVTDSPYFVPFIGRGPELERAKDLLVSDKLGIIVVGESGVGKTAFAQQLGCAVSDNAAASGVEYGGLYKLRAAALIADDTDGNRIVDNLVDVLKTLEKSKSTVLIEDLPVLLSISSKLPPGKVSEAIEDAIASMDLLVVATATPAAYADGEAENETLFRRLEIINLSEPSDDEMIKILNGAKDAFEAEYSARISESAIETAIRLAARSKIVRALPAGALELLDRACMAARLEVADMENRRGRTTVAAEDVERVFEDTFSDEDARRESNPEAYV